MACRNCPEIEVWVGVEKEGRGPTWDKMATEGMFPSALTICCATCVYVVEGESASRFFLSRRTGTGMEGYLSGCRPARNADYESGIEWITCLGIPASETVRA